MRRVQVQGALHSTDTSRDSVAPCSLFAVCLAQAKMLSCELGVSWKKVGKRPKSNALMDKEAYDMC